MRKEKRVRMKLRMLKKYKKAVNEIERPSIKI